MSTPKQFDVVVIGAGPGGYIAAMASDRPGRGGPISPLPGKTANRL